jgi:hypothetical protein
VACLLAAAALAGSALSHAYGAASGVHPWLDLLPAAGAGAGDLAPLAITRWDALDLDASLRGRPTLAEASVSLRARYRLDADEYLERKRADRDDLATVHRARRELARREAVLTWFAERCAGVWRAWQVDLLTPHPLDPAPGAEAAYLTALRALLANAATAPATVVDVDACRLERWLGAVALAPDAPELAAAASEARLEERSGALVHAAAPPIAWLEAEVRVGQGSHGALTLRAGLDLPVARGGLLALAVDGQGPDLSLSWHGGGVDDRIAARHGVDARPGSGLAAVRDAAYERRRAEAQLAVADARLRWTRACGGASAEAVIGCLGRARSGAPERDGLLAAIEAELGALEANLALVAAAGHDLADLLHAATEVER